jgi:L-seryl-tRNA(Ser) seleniumtransferase
VTDLRRNLPGVDVLLSAPAFRELVEGHPRPRVVKAIREVLEAVRRELEETGGEEEGRGPFPEVSPADYAGRAALILEEWSRPSLRPVINATGVVLHTNLGRAPLSRATREAMARAGEGYSNLEFDLEGGGRGSRYVHCVDLLRELTGAPDVLVVNNCAAAVVLALNTLGRGRQVLVSRGELVEIGGGFRIPEMLARSGAVLREVGTTNRTRLSDYREVAQDEEVAGILKVHRSNFRLTGFTEEASLEELAELARARGLFLVHDLGSGLYMDTERLGLPFEPRAPESLRKGVQAVATSGDKLLGGPQAGIILGQKGVVGAMRDNPLCRALRVDKVTLAGLEATLRHYLDPEEALREIPALRMLALPLEELKERARQIQENLEGGMLEVRVEEGSGRVGGGTYPGVELPTWLIRVRPRSMSAETLAARLRDGDPPVVGRREDDEVLLDLRTVEEKDDRTLVRRLLQAAE